MNSHNAVRRTVMMRIIGLIAACIILAILVVWLSMRPATKRTPSPHDHLHGTDQGSDQKQQPSREEIEQAVAKFQSKTAVIETDLGTIKFRFYPEDAPRTVENFAQLAEKGFYDGSPFHRVVRDFVIQGGSPDGSPSGGPGYTVPAEFNEHRHVEGTVAMARSADPNSAGSQFYICLQPARHLDGKYTVFGQVVKGMDVVKKIGETQTDASGRPLERINMKRVRIEESAEPATPE